VNSAPIFPEPRPRSEISASRLNQTPILISSAMKAVSEMVSHSPILPDAFPNEGAVGELLGRKSLR
jgi:hypothetical protein